MIIIPSLNERLSMKLDWNNKVALSFSSSKQKKLQSWSPMIMMIVSLVLGRSDSVFCWRSVLLSCSSNAPAITYECPVIILDNITLSDALHVDFSNPSWLSPVIVTQMWFLDSAAIVYIFDRIGMLPFGGGDIPLGSSRGPSPCIFSVRVYLFRSSFYHSTPIVK